MGFGKALVKKCKMNVKNIPGLVQGSPIITCKRI